MILSDTDSGNGEFRAMDSDNAFVIVSPTYGGGFHVLYEIGMNFKGCPAGR